MRRTIHLESGNLTGRNRLFLRRLSEMPEFHHKIRPLETVAPVRIKQKSSYHPTALAWLAPRTHDSVDVAAHCLQTNLRGLIVANRRAIAGVPLSHRPYSGFLTHNIRELTALAANNELDDILFRDELVAEILSHFEAGRSVLLSGLTGVGKTAIIHRLAQTLAAGPRNRFYELSTSEIIADVRGSGDWQTKTAV